MSVNDTIVAVSSASGGEGVRAIVRVSGGDALRAVGEVVALPGEMARGYLSGMDLRGWGMGNGLAALAVFEGPRSFTGENVVELHVPNSPAVVGWIIERLLAAGGAAGWSVRMAGPGEFSARAFFNGKIDLTEAEGIAATIAAGNAAELRAAASLREGDLHRWTAATAETLANLLALVEAGIDFVEEEGVAFIGSEDLRARLLALAGDVRAQLEMAVRIDRLEDLPTVVFVGRPNVGKSSLINALAGRERSIVSPVAGTTRDMLGVVMATGHGAVRLVDVPGEEPPTDELRQKMMAVRASALLDADLVVEVAAAGEASAEDAAPEAAYAARRVQVLNKADLVPPGAGAGAGDAWRWVSAKTGVGVGELREELGRLVSREAAGAAGRLVLNHRHRAILQELQGAIARAAALTADSFERHPELLAAELRRGLDLLGQITGTISPDEVLGRIFSQFCIGK